jgi:hypothetical protein
MFVVEEGQSQYHLDQIPYLKAQPPETNTVMSYHKNTKKLLVLATNVGW